MLKFGLSDKTWLRYHKTQDPISSFLNYRGLWKEDPVYARLGQAIQRQKLLSTSDACTCRASGTGRITPVSEKCSFSESHCPAIQQQKLLPTPWFPCPSLPFPPPDSLIPAAETAFLRAIALQSSESRSCQRYSSPEECFFTDTGIKLAFAAFSRFPFCRFAVLLFWHVGLLLSASCFLGCPLSQHIVSTTLLIWHSGYTCVYIYIYIYIYVCMYVCMYACMYVCIHTYMYYMYVGVYIYIYICVYIYILCSYVHVNTCIYIYIYIHIISWTCQGSSSLCRRRQR